MFAVLTFHQGFRVPTVTGILTSSGLRYVV